MRPATITIQALEHKYPDKSVMIRRFNDSDEKDDYNLGAFLETGKSLMLNMLDEQALRSIRTMILIEVVRYTSKRETLIWEIF